MSALRTEQPGAFVHEALFYDGVDDFVEKVGAFVREGVEQDEPTLVVARPSRLDPLREALGGAAESVLFGDMDQIGRNPAWIIPAWTDFVAKFSDEARPLRGVGEPIWSERPADELIECQRHEELLNVAFEGGRPWRLVCPYDTTALDAPVLEQARRSHPFHSNGHSVVANAHYVEPAGPFEAPLREPTVPVVEVAFGEGDLASVRRFIRRHAAPLGFDEQRLADLLVAVNELTGNSIRHGGGRGILRMWCEGSTLVCEVADAGRIVDPLVGRVRPEPTQERGYGMWVVSQLCDLVQVRTYPTGTVVRVHMRAV